MQEFQSIPGLAGRLFGGVAAGAADLRRAQAHAHAQQGPGAARCGGVSPAAAGPPEAVKCPRCESTNTKFCYYNNYNLSQPRHFCKSCRRYWTKGGVLRNVPVGGGCRKTKRASSSSSSSSATSAPSTPTSGSGGDAAAANKNPRRASASSPRSNSNSGSASPTAAATTMPTPNPSTPATPSSNSSSVVAAFTTSSHHHHSTNPFSTIDVVAPPAPIFADQAAALASLFAPPPPPPLPVFTFAAQQPKVEAPTTPSELELQLVAGHGQDAPPCSSSMVVSEDMAPFASLDDAAGIFELGDAASAAAYWNAGSCWTTDMQDPSMYLP